MVSASYESPPPSVVVITHIGGPHLSRCLDGLARQTVAPDHIHVVVSSTDEIEIPAGVQVTRLTQPAHFAQAANVGLLAERGNPIVLLNDDTVPSERFIEQLCKAVTGPGIYQPRIILADGSNRIDNTGHRLFLDGFNFARGRGRQGGEFSSEAGAFSGAAALITPEVMATVGLFDEDFEAFGEDLDLSLRARRAGFRIHYVPDAVIHHELGASYGRVSARKIFLVERNRTRAAVRSLPLMALAALPTTTMLRLSLQASGAAMGRGLGVGAGPFGCLAALAGNGAGWLCIPQAWAKRRRDRSHWKVQERDMLRHLVQHRARTSDVLGAAGTP